MKATYNLSKIMRNAWYLKRANASMSFSACLKKAWRNADKRAFNTSHSCNSSCIVFILFPLLHLDKFAAMRAGDCVRRLRGEKLRGSNLQSIGHFFERVKCWLLLSRCYTANRRLGNSNLFGQLIQRYALFFT